MSSHCYQIDDLMIQAEQLNYGLWELNNFVDQLLLLAEDCNNSIQDLACFRKCIDKLNKLSDSNAETSIEFLENANWHENDKLEQVLQQQCEHFAKVLPADQLDIKQTIDPYLMDVLEQQNAEINDMAQIMRRLASIGRNITHEETINIESLSMEIGALHQLRKVSDKEITNEVAYKSSSDSCTQTRITFEKDFPELIESENSKIGQCQKYKQQCVKQIPTATKTLMPKKTNVRQKSIYTVVNRNMDSTVSKTLKSNAAAAANAELRKKNRINLDVVALNKQRAVADRPKQKNIELLQKSIDGKQKVTTSVNNATVVAAKTKRTKAMPVGGTAKTTDVKLPK